MKLFHKKENKSENEYTFIWYKKMESNGTCFYTQPFRTKVSAESKDIAKDKLMQFIRSKFKVIIVEENKYNKTDLAKFDNEFIKINNRLQEIIKTTFEKVTKNNICQKNIKH